MVEIKGFWKKFKNCDWTRFPQILFLTIIYLISRIPFLNLGFGYDADAWRIANSAWDLNQHMVYHTSRFPGYPFPEYVNSIFINFGWIATNSLTMILSFISILVFARILKELEVKNKGLIIITFAFLPLLWVYSVNTMDYMWALTFIIIAWYFLVKKQYIPAGIFMGLAIASRPTSAIFFFPFLYLILTENKIKSGIYFLLSSIIVSAFLFIPLFAQYGLGFVSLNPPVTSLNAVLQGLFSYFGLLTIIFFIILIISSSKNIYKTIKSDKNLIFASFAVFLVTLLFVSSPFETAYLLPAIPFALYLFSKISNERLFAILCILLIANSFISINIPSDSSGTLENGIIFKDGDERALLTDISLKTVELPLNNSLIVAGDYYPVVGYFLRTSKKNTVILDSNESNGMIVTEGNEIYIYMISTDNLLKWQNKGFKIYYMGNSTIILVRYNYKYKLNDYNITNIFRLIY